MPILTGSMGSVNTEVLGFPSSALATTLNGAITATSPANGGSLIVTSTAAFASSGTVVVTPGLTSTAELITYTGTTATAFTGITRVQAATSVEPTANTKYFWRVGGTSGMWGSFLTTPAPPAGRTLALCTTINAASTGTYSLDYGPTTAYGTTVTQSCTMNTVCSVLAKNVAAGTYHFACAPQAPGHAHPGTIRYQLFSSR